MAILTTLIKSHPALRAKPTSVILPDQDSNLKLNNLARYSKQSPRLVLEEYGHCEVPAGCGGAVLRWRNPNEPIPMVIQTSYSNGLPTILLDGQKTVSARNPVSYGTHTLAITINNFDPNFAILSLRAWLDEQYVRILQPTGDVEILSKPDGTWKYTLRVLATDEWRQPDFDDTNWLPMVEKPIKPNPHGFTHWDDRLKKHGMVPLGLSGEQALTQISTVYIRKIFTLYKKGE